MNKNVCKTSSSGFEQVKMISINRISPFLDYLSVCFHRNGTWTVSSRVSASAEVATPEVQYEDDPKWDSLKHVFVAKRISVVKVKRISFFPSINYLKTELFISSQCKDFKDLIGCKL